VPRVKTTTGATATIFPRLLDVRRASAYLSVSCWTLRDWHAGGLIEAVDLPGLRAREGGRPKQRLRRLLFDVRDLDTFVDSLKARRGVAR
jgi:hypothetical protein